MIIKLKRNHKYDDFLAYYDMTAFFIMSTTMVDIIRLIALQYLPQITSVENIIRNGVYAICALYAIVVILSKKPTKKFFACLITVAIFLIVSLLINPEIITYLEDSVIIFVLRVLVGLFLISHVTDYKQLVEKLLMYFIPTIMYIILFALVGYVNDNYMGFSYSLLVPATIYCIYGYAFKKNRYLIVGVLGLILILAYGARGAFAAGVVGIGLYFIISSKQSFRKMIIIALGIVVLLVLTLNFYKVVELLLKYFETSRTLKILLSGQLYNGGGRSIIQRIVIENISFLPRGFFSDRFIIAKGIGMNVNESLYPHNLFIEVIFQFGIILGVTFLVLLITKVIKALILTVKEKSNEQDILFYSLVIPYLFKAMLSGSYLTDYTFGIALGICISILRIKQKRKKMYGKAIAKKTA